MKTGTKLTALLAMMYLAMGAGIALGQDKPVEDRPQPVVADVKPIRQHSIKIGERSDRPRPSAVTSVDVPERVQPAELKHLIENFRTARERFLLEQRESLQQLKEATDEQRAELREKMRENLEEWRELQKEFRAQAVERAREIREQLNQDLERVVEDGAKSDTGTRPRE